MTEASQSYMAMFLGAIALLWADGKLSDEEREKMHQLIDGNVELSPNQKELLKQDVETPVKLGDVWDKISEPHDRAHLINIAQMLFWADGAYCHSEEEVYHKMKEKHLATLDVGSLQAEMDSLLIEQKQRLTKEEKELVDDMMPHTRFFYYLEKKLDKVLGQ